MNIMFNQTFMLEIATPNFWPSSCHFLGTFHEEETSQVGTTIERRVVPGVVPADSLVAIPAHFDVNLQLTM